MKFPDNKKDDTNGNLIRRQYRKKRCIPDMVLLEMGIKYHKDGPFLGQELLNWLVSNWPKYYSEPSDSDRRNFQRYIDNYRNGRYKNTRPAYVALKIITRAKAALANKYKPCFFCQFCIDEECPVCSK